MSPEQQAGWQWLYRLYATRAGLALVVLASLFFPWALRTSTPLLAAGHIALTTGWELQGGTIVALLAPLILVSLYSHLSRPRRPRPVARWILTSVIGLVLLGAIWWSVQPGLLGTETFGDLQPAYRVAFVDAQILLLSCVIEAAVLFRMRRGRAHASVDEVGPANELTASAPMVDGKEIVLLIHGTGATALADSGPAWWQAGSAFDRQLTGILPERIRCHREGEVFHWSGANIESERRRAGRLLYEVLTDLEKKSIKYHLVGHSHGGSVVLHALKASIRRGTPLSNLLSWTTMGTPFLHYGVTLSRAPLLFVPIVTVLATWLWQTENLVRSLGTAWPYLIEERQYPTIYMIVGLGTVVALVVAFNLYLLVRLFVSLMHHRRDRDLEARAMSLYGSSWLCIWSASDEAIRGLQSTIGAEGDTILPIPSDTDTFFHRVRRLVDAPFRVPFNYVIRPALNGALWKQLRRRIQGNDEALAEICAVEAWPRGGVHQGSLSRDTEQRVVELANRYANESVGALRTLLGSNATSRDQVSLLTQRLSKQLNGRELVHCGYYNDEELIATIASRIVTPSESLATASAAIEDTRGGDAVDHSPPPRPGSSWTAGWPAVAIQLGVLLAVVASAQFLKLFVIDRFLPETQVKDSLYAPAAGDMQASLETGSVASVEAYREVLRRATLEFGGDPRIDFLNFRDRLREKRWDDAANLLASMTHPFFATTALTLFDATSPVDFAPERLALSADLKIDLRPFREIAPSITSQEQIDGIVQSAVRLRGSPMRAEPIDRLFRAVFGRLNYSWIKDKTTADAYDAAALSKVHLRAWTRDAAALADLRSRSGWNASLPRTITLEIMLRFATPSRLSDEDRRNLSLSIAHGPFNAERRELPRILIRHGAWSELKETARLLKYPPEPTYGSVPYFREHRYFALTELFDQLLAGKTPGGAWLESFADVAGYGDVGVVVYADLEEFPSRVQSAADDVVQGRWDGGNMTWRLEALDAYALVQVARRLVASGHRVSALRVAQRALAELTAGESAAYPAPIRNDEFTRLAVVFAEAGDLYTASRIAHSFVPKEDRLDVWTAILLVYEKALAQRRMDPAARLRSLMNDVDREHGMVRGVSARWNDGRW